MSRGLRLTASRIWARRRAAVRTAAHGFNALLEDLGRCWFIFAIAILATVVLVYIPQGREALFAATEPSQPLHGVLLYGVILLGGLQVTLFSALLLEDQTAPGVRPVRRYVAYYVPALMGLAAVFAVPILLQEHLLSGSELLQSRRDALLGLGWLLQLPAGILIPLARNQDMLDALSGSASAPGAHKFNGAALLLLFVLNAAVALFIDSFLISAVVLAVGVGLIDLLNWRGALRPRVSTARKGLGLVYALFFIGAGLYVAAQPVARAPAIGAATTLVLAIHFWMALGLIAALISRRLPRTVSVIVFLIAAWSFLSGPFNRAPVRTLGETASVRPDLGQYTRAWLDQRLAQIRTEERYPVFVVLAEGGGIRAAYWTAAVLGALQDRDGNFARHVFAISGVSGGSLGAAVFTALHSQLRGDRDLRCAGAPGAVGAFEGCAAAVLAHDFLSPPLAAMVVADVGRGVTRTTWLPDRAEALEVAVERAWRSATGGDAFERRFDRLWEDTVLSPPALFLNGTDALSGDRLLMSNVRLEGQTDPESDLAAVLAPRTVRLSTAVMMSARFPGISPIGIIERQDGTALGVVDGGYFDNSGAATAADLLAELDSAASAAGVGDRIHPVVILIANAPWEPAAGTPTLSPLAATPLGAMLTPVSTLDRIRSGSAERFKAALRQQVEAAGGEYMTQFRLQTASVEFPLGWMLSAATREAMHQQIEAMFARADSDAVRVLDLTNRAGALGSAHTTPGRRVENDAGEPGDP